MDKLKLQFVHPMLPDLDSNQDKQNQNLSYYHYTIGQTIPDLSGTAGSRLSPKECKNKVSGKRFQKQFKNLIKAVIHGDQ